MAGTEQRPTAELQPFAWGVKIPLGYRLKKRIKDPRFYLMLMGVLTFFFIYYALVDLLKVPRFKLMPSLLDAAKEWVSKDPVYGISIYTDITTVRL